MFAQALILQSELVFNLIVYSPRNAETTALGHSFYASCYVDAISVNPVAFDNDVAKVDTDPKFHSSIFWQLSISGPQLLLNLHCTAHRIYHTGKLGQKVVTWGINHPATVFLDDRADYSPVGR